jgi:hypothetical protein
VSFAGIGGTHHSGSPPPENDDSGISSDQSESRRFDPLPSDDVVTEKDSSYYHHRQSVAETRNPADAPVTLPSPPSERTSYSRFAMSEAKALNEKANHDKNNNNTLDVDAFTRLLLTGSAKPTSNTTSTSQKAASTPDTASDPITRVQSEVPIGDNKANNSIESEPSQAGDIGGMTRAATLPATLPARTESNEIPKTYSIRRPKPPPPRSHHGKPIKPGDSAPLKTNENDTSNFMSVPFQTPPANHRESLSSISDRRTSSPSLSETDTADDTSSLHRTPSQSKRPPTPPIARRRSQMIKPSTLERPNRLSMPPKALGSQLPGPLSPGFGVKTPPRPPSRRHDKTATGVQADSTSQPKSSPLQGESTPPVNPSTDEQASTASLSPPSRQPSFKLNSAGSTTTTESGSLMPPPPPPPRRLRASSKGSTSSAQATAVVAALTAEKAGVDDNETNEPPSSSNMQDILADLSRLQQEVDDLRVHYEGRRVSQ